MANDDFAPDIEDKNVFMMCAALDRSALRELPAGFTVRNLRRDELDWWKAAPFDDAATAAENRGFMDGFFATVYGGREDRFFEETLVVCDGDVPIATCLIWKSYDRFNAIHWLKVVPGYEDRGIGRALLSILMRDLPDDAYPIYLHTQPGSYRAIKLYADFGFHLLSGDRFGTRKNELDESLGYLEAKIPADDFAKLVISPAPEEFIAALADTTTEEF